MKLSAKQKTVVGIITILAILAMIPHNCFEPKGTQRVEITVPEISGSFDTVVPKEIILTRTVYKTKYRDKIIETENPLNKELLDRYSKAKDSLEAAKVFIDAIVEREYNETFENDTIKIDIYSKTQGKLLLQKPSYVIKERKIKTEIPVKQTKLAMYIGGGLFNTLSLHNLGFKADIGIQDKKGIIYRVGYDSNNYIHLGLNVKILDIKK